MPSKYRLELRKNRCKSCGLCVDVCPKSVLYLDPNEANSLGYHAAAVGAQEDCIGCAGCALMCPDGVIEIYEEC